MHPEEASQKVQDLSDVELGLLSSLIAKEHCIIQTEEDTLDALEDEIRLVHHQPTPSIDSSLRFVSRSALVCSAFMPPVSAALTPPLRRISTVAFSSRKMRSMIQV